MLRRPRSDLLFIVIASGNLSDRSTKQSNDGFKVMCAVLSDNHGFYNEESSIDHSQRTWCLQDRLLRSLMRVLVHAFRTDDITFTTDSGGRHPLMNNVGINRIIVETSRYPNNS